MDRIVQNLLDPSWWFTSIVVALAISMVAMPLHAALARWWGRQSIRRKVSAVVANAAFNAELERMVQRPELVAIKLIDDRADQGNMVLLIFVQVAITLDTITAFGEAGGLFTKALLVCGPLGALLLLASVYRKMLRRSILLAAYKERIIRSSEQRDG